MKNSILLFTMIFIVFNGTFNGFDPLILLKMIRTYKQGKPSVKSTCHLMIICKIFKVTNAYNSLILRMLKFTKEQTLVFNEKRGEKGIKNLNIIS